MLSKKDYEKTIIPNHLHAIIIIKNEHPSVETQNFASLRKSGK